MKRKKQVIQEANDAHRSMFRPRKPGKAWSGRVRHDKQLEGGTDSRQHAFWKPGQRGTKGIQVQTNAREIRANYAERGLTRDEIRVLWIKRQHEKHQLKKKYPEVDWERPSRDAQRCRDFARMRTGRHPKK